MDHTPTKTIRKLKKMHLKGPECCLEELGRFSALVDELSDHSFKLSSKQSHFLGCLVRLREEMVADSPFFVSVEESLHQNQTILSNLFEEIWFVKEGMRMHEGNFAAFFHEEYMIDHHATKFEKRKKEHENSIQEDIINLLIKRSTLVALKSKQRELGKELSDLMNKSEIAKSFRQTIHNFWTAAADVANLS